MNVLLAMSRNIHAVRERGKDEAVTGFSSRFATFSKAHTKAPENSQHEKQDTTGASVGGDDTKKRKRGRKPKGGNK